ncbi:MAG: DNA repair protein, partial [Bacteroidales bacterium 45-6]
MKWIYKVAEVELSYKPSIKRKERLKIKSAKDAYQVLMSTFREGTVEHREYFKVLLLNQSNEVLGYQLVAECGISACPVDIRVILQSAILTNASGLIVAHNHPSGNLEVSSQDISITQRIKE